MKVYRLHFIRHARTQGNVDGRFVGVQDMPALAEGLKEIAQYKEEGIYPQVSKVYTSPLLRCLQTAETIYPDYPTEILAGLKELDFGHLEGKTLEEAENSPAFAIEENPAGNENPLGQFPGGESMENLGERLYGAVNYMIEEMRAGDISSAAVVTHGGLIAMAMATWGIPKQPPFYWMTENGCGYTVLIQPDFWDKNQCFEIYDRIGPYHGQEVDEDAYLDYAESLLDEEDLRENGRE